VGRVGAGTLPFPLAVPMIMGANIGTTITSTLAALGSIRRAEEFRKGFAAATMHDFFTLLTVAILLPLELATGVLSRVATALTGVLRGTNLNYSEPARSPIREAVRWPVHLMDGFMPPGRITAVVFLALALTLIFVALALITRHMRQLVAGGVERAINRLIGRGGGAIGILVGIGVTVAVQSSSITTSILVPLVASGVLALHSAYPITLGANIGTTVTALIASLAVARPEGLSIALVHLLFNCFGVAILYPVPTIRVIPIRLAQKLANLAAARHRVVAIWVISTFVILPLMGLFLFQ
jgi:solute carrier family 34 (sodium-dependent phosphate cotransporter)